VELPPTTDLRGAPAHDDLADDAHNGPRQPRYDARQVAPARVPGVDRGRVGQAARVPLDDGFGRVKISIPPFSGSGTPEDYLKWEMRMNHIFAAHQFSEDKKLQLPAMEFSGYVLIWWTQILMLPQRPATWRGMTELMQRRFVPEYFKRELHNRLQQLTQGTKSVEEYYKEMELLMIRTETRENREATMSRFLHGLNYEIRDRVEMVYYHDLQDLVHQAERSEQQIKRHRAAPLHIHGASLRSTLLLLVHRRCLLHSPVLLLLVRLQSLLCHSLRPACSL
jgi:hypothetical protein